jgi:hypothetical protein
VALDIKRNNLSILDSSLVIPVSTKTSFGNNAAQFVDGLASVVLEDNDELIVEIVTPGANTKGLLVSFIGNAE